MTPQEWSRIQQGIFRGESGGDYGALFGYQNRPNGRFEGTDLTKMTVDQALDFAKPSGPYGQYVKGEVGRVATPMGAYQVVGTTLRDAKNALGLTGNEVMDQGLQDKIGQWIYKSQGTGAWEGYKPINDDQAIASDTMRVLGKQPKGLLATAQATDDTESKMIPEEKPKGLLGSLGIQKMVEGAEGEAGQRFFQRDTFKDTAAQMAPLLAAMGSSPALQKATAGIAAQRTEAKARNKSLELLANLPGGQEFVRIAEIAGPKAGVQAYLESRKAPKDTRTDDLKEYAQAQSNGFKGTFIEYKQALASSGSSSSFGEKVSTYKNAYPEASDAEILEMIKDPAKMPAAYQSLVLRAKDAGLEPGTPKYENFMRTGGVGDATFSREEAKLRSEGLANLPIDIETSKQALDVLDLALSKDYRAGLKKFVGPLDAYLPNISGAAKRFKAIHNQIKGKTFMEAYKTLKGGGQITEMEGDKATKAIARLNNSQNEEDYIEALRELRGIIQKQYMRSQSKLSEFKGGQSASGWEIVE